MDAKLKLTCDFCGNDYLRYRDRDKKNNYCSRRCFYESQSRIRGHEEGYVGIFDEIVAKRVNSGKPRTGNPEPSSQSEKVQRLLESSDTLNNQISALPERDDIVQVRQGYRGTCASDYSMQKEYLLWWNREPVQFMQDKDSNTMVAIYLGYYRVGTGWDDWRFIYGNLV